jgi:hypothetical protein
VRGKFSRQLDAQRRVGVGGEFQEDGLAAGIATKHDAYLLRFAVREVIELRGGDRRNVRQRLAMRAGQCNALVLDMQFILRRDVNAHC